MNGLFKPSGIQVNEAYKDIIDLAYNVGVALKIASFYMWTKL